MSPPLAGAASSASALLRWQFKHAHALLDSTVERLTTETVYRQPLGTAAPVGACYAQVVLCEDLSVNGMLAAGMPLALSTWVGRTGLSELPSLARLADWRTWARSVRLDLAELRPYARAVYAATDTYLATLPDDALDPARTELPAYLLSALLLTLAMGCGEIACLLAIERWSAPDGAQG